MADHGYDKLTVKELKETCRSLNIRGYSKCRKAELIKLLTDNQGEHALAQDFKSSNELTPLLDKFDPEYRGKFAELTDKIVVKFQSKVREEDKLWILLEILRYASGYGVCGKLGTWFTVIQWTVNCSVYMGRKFYVVSYKRKNPSNENDSNRRQRAFRIEIETCELYKSSGTNPMYCIKTHVPTKNVDELNQLGLIPDWLEEKEDKPDVKLVDIPTLSAATIISSFHAMEEEDEELLESIKSDCKIKFADSIPNKAREVISLLLLRRVATKRIIGGRSDAYTDEDGNHFLVKDGKYMNQRFYNICGNLNYFAILGVYTFRVKADSLELYRPSGKVPAYDLVADDYILSVGGDIPISSKNCEDYRATCNELWDRLGLRPQNMTKPARSLTSYQY